MPRKLNDNFYGGAGYAPPLFTTVTNQESTDFRVLHQTKSYQPVNRANVRGHPEALSRWCAKIGDKEGRFLRGTFRSLRIDTDE